MDHTTFMILDELTRNLGRDFSIHGLTEEIRRDYRTGYYKNIYDKVIALKESNDLLLTRVGRSSVVTLNFKNYGLLNLLSQLELIKKRRLTGGDSETGMLFSEMNSLFGHGFCAIDSVSAINHEKNRSLNRVEFLFIMKDLKAGGGEEKTTGILEDETYRISEKMRSLERTHNLKIDYATLSETEFSALVKEADHNPIKEMLSSKIVLTNQENFWSGMKKIYDEGINIKSAGEVNPAKIAEEDIVHNLSRFGYREMGAEAGAGKDYCIETVVTSLLLKKDARRIEAIPVILRKNLEKDRKPVFNLLIFLAGKYNNSGKMLGLLKSLSRHSDDKSLLDAVTFMEKTGVMPGEIDEESVEQKMRLYYGD